MKRAFAIAVTNTRRMFRLRTNLFFAFVFPMILILVLGATFGGSDNPRVGVVSPGSGPLEAALVAQLRSTPHLRVSSVASRAALVSRVSRGELSGGLVIPAGYDAAVSGGRTATVDYVGRPDASSQRLKETVDGAVAQQATLLGAAGFAVSQHAADDFGSALAAARAILPTTPVVSVAQSSAGKARTDANLGRFDESAWTELLLFLFFTALSGSLALIESRRLGLSRRMLSTPTSAAVVVAGETMGRMLIGLIQATVIVFGSALVFNVKWGQPLGVIAVVVLFLLVADGAGICLGTLLRNEQQAIAVSVLAGMGLAAIGGCMVPLEVFSSTMKRVAHITPHAWANDAFAQLVGHNAGIGGIVPQLAVLAGFAAVLMALATWRLRRVLVA
jgi:ABC-2 type transport system permease protein